MLRTAIAGALEERAADADAPADWDGGRVVVAGAARPRSGRCCECAYWSDARADDVPYAYGACALDADAPRATRADSVHAWEECWVPLPDGRGRDFAVRPRTPAALMALAALLGLHLRGSGPHRAWTSGEEAAVLGALDDLARRTGHTRTAVAAKAMHLASEGR